MKLRDFDPLDPFPAWWTDAWQEFWSTAQVNFVVRIKPSDPTVLEVPAGADNDQVGVGIEGSPRWIAARIERVSPGGGTARDLDVWVTSTANSYSPGVVDDVPIEIDNTVYAFALAITETGVPPTGVAIKRKIAVARWDGAKFTQVSPIIGGTAYPPSGMVKLAELAPSAGVITFSSIPQEFKGLRLRGKVRADATITNEVLSLRFNGSSAAEYSYESVTAITTAVSSAGAGAQDRGGLVVPSDESTGLTAVHTALDLEVFNYTATAEEKSWLFRTLRPKGGNAAPEVRWGGGRWANVAAITSLSLLMDSPAALDASSLLTLYGIR